MRRLLFAVALALGCASRPAAPRVAQRILAPRPSTLARWERLGSNPFEGPLAALVSTSAGAWALADGRLWSVTPGHLAASCAEAPRIEQLWPGAEDEVWGLAVVSTGFALVRATARGCTVELLPTNQGLQLESRGFELAAGPGGVALYQRDRDALLLREARSDRWRRVRVTERTTRLLFQGSSLWASVALSEAAPGQEVLLRLEGDRWVSPSPPLEVSPGALRALADGGFRSAAQGVEWELHPGQPPLRRRALPLGAEELRYDGEGLLFRRAGRWWHLDDVGDAPPRSLTDWPLLARVRGGEFLFARGRSLARRIGEQVLLEQLGLPVAPGVVVALSAAEGTTALLVRQEEASGSVPAVLFGNERGEHWSAPRPLSESPDTRIADPYFALLDGRRAFLGSRDGVWLVSEDAARAVTNEALLPAVEGPSPSALAQENLWVARGSQALLSEDRGESWRLLSRELDPTPWALAVENHEVFVLDAAGVRSLSRPASEAPADSRALPNSASTAALFVRGGVRVFCVNTVWFRSSPGEAPMELPHRAPCRSGHLGPDLALYRAVAPEERCGPEGVVLERLDLQTLTAMHSQDDCLHPLLHLTWEQDRAVALSPSGVLWQRRWVPLP